MARADIEWMVTADVKQQFTWTATAVSPPPAECPDRFPPPDTRAVNGSGSYSLAFTVPKYRAWLVSVIDKAANTKNFRSLVYAPRGAPKVKEATTVQAPVNIAGSFTDTIQSCDSWKAGTETAPADGCGSRTATLQLGIGFGVYQRDQVLKNARLNGTIQQPWFVGTDGRTALCPTYESIGLRYFDGGKGGAGCPDIGALDPGGSAALGTGLANASSPGEFAARLKSAHPKPITITVDKPLDCTLTPSDSSLPALDPGGTLRVTGALHYVMTWTPKKVAGKAARWARMR